MPARITFVLNEPRNPKNIGAAARGMANFGFRALAVVKPYAEAWRETRAAVNAHAVVEKAKRYVSLKNALKNAHVVIGTSAGYRRKEMERWIGLEELRSLVGRAAADGRSVALVFGSERSGLSNEDLAQCHHILRIPTDPACPSMNLSQAVAVVACAIQDVAAGHPHPNPLPKGRGGKRGNTALQSPPPLGRGLGEGPGERKGGLVNPGPQIPIKHLEVLVARGLAAYNAAGLHKGWDPRRASARLRKALYRWNLTDVDVQMLHGLFGWVIKKAS